MRQARRYHWLGSQVEEFTEEPQAAICCDYTHNTLNLVSGQNNEVRSLSVQLACLPPKQLLSELSTIQACSHLCLPRQHSIPNTGYLNRSLHAAYEQQPGDFETLLGVKGGTSHTARPVFGSRSSFWGAAQFRRSGPLFLCPRRQGRLSLPCTRR